MRTDDTYGPSPLQPVWSCVEYERQILQAICQSLSVPKSVMDCVSDPVRRDVNHSSSLDLICLPHIVPSGRLIDRVH